MTKTLECLRSGILVIEQRIVTETDELRLAADNRKLSNRSEPGPSVRRRSRILRSFILTVVIGIGTSSIANAATLTVSKTTDTNDGTCDADCSLREAITAANLVVGPHTISFDVPLGDLTGGVAIIAVGSALPPITRNNVIIDGTTQTTNNGNTNPVILGSGGAVGVDALPLSQVAGPEVEIRAGVAIAIGLQIQATNATVRGIAILGFGAANGEGAIVIDAGFTGALIENNVLGSTATSFTDPGAALHNYAGIESVGGDNGTIRNNLIGFGHRGVFLTTGSTGWTVEGNEIRDNDVTSPDGDGIAISGSSSNNLSGNLVTGSSSQGFVVTNSSLSNFTNNTVTGNGVGSSITVTQSAGITMRSTASSTVVDRNIVQSNYGAGIQVNNGAIGTIITRNSFANNGAIAARSPPTLTGQVGIDLNIAGDDVNVGTPNYYSINDQADTLQDFPILETATISAGNLVLTGWAKPGATIEVFIAAADPFGFGEGETYVGTFVEGSLVVPIDTDSSSSPYSGPINGLNQGADTTNRFSFTVPTPAGVSNGTQLTSTATLGTETSEFSGVATATAASTISGRVFEDVNYGGGAGRDQATASGVVRSGARVELYDATGTFVSFTTTDGSGNYSFPGLAAANHTVRVVNSTVSSSRAGYIASLRGVQTYRTDASSGSAVAVSDHVGGQDPSVVDAGNGSAGAVMNTTTGVFTAVVSGTAQSITNAVLGAGDINGVDFGFNFDTIVNINNSGQGSLRQFLTNANTLIGDASLAQVGRPAGIENGIFMISNGTAAAGLQAGNNYFVAGVATIAPTATLPPIDQPIVLNAQLQPGWVAAPIIRLDGASAVPAPVDGLTLANGSDGSTIRGVMFTRFSRDGVVIQAGADGVTIAGNWLGTDGSGVTTMGNTNDGLEVFGAGATIGGIGGDDRNVIVNNLNEGINIAGASASGNFVLGNYIGLEPDGTTGQGNGDVGIAILAGGGGNTIGGTTPAARNVISMNFEGIEISSASNIVQGNFIGTDAGGTLNRGQTDSDSVQILAGGNDNVIGGTTDDEANLIAFTKSGRHGVSVQGGTGNAVLRNSTHSNTGLGIELGNNDVTVNDGVKSGGQPNLLMDYPAFTSATLAGTTLTLAGYVGSAPGQPLFANARVEVFESDNDVSGFGEGQTFLGFLTTDASGNFSGSIDVTGKGLVVGETISGTATDGTSNTSEFSANVNVTTAEVSIAATTDANEAGAVNGLFTVTQTATSASNTVITYSIAGSATDGGTDYATLSGSVTVLAGATTATIDVTGIIDDALVEGDETVIVTLTGTDNVDVTVAASPADTATVNILDNNAANVSIAATTDANETGPVDGVFTITQSTTSATDTVITYSIAGTATDGGTDYTTLSGSVTVLAGATTTTIDVTGIVDDALVEGDETVVVTLTATDNPGITVATSPADTATVNILDNNAATVSIASTTDANETGAVNGLFTVTQTATSASNTVITYSIAGTATDGGTDYTTLSGSVTVLAGATTTTIDVTGIVDDALVEGDETVVVTLTATDNPGITVATSPADTATVNILDNNAATVSIASTTDANETGAVNGLFTVTQTATSASNTVITYSIAGTATDGGTDYTTLSGSVTVLAGATTATIDVTGIVDDALVEGTETVIVTLTGTDNVDVTVAASPADTATVNILDNNAATVNIAANTDANEAGPVDGLFTVTQSATSATDTVVSYSIAGTATDGGTDYATLSGSVTVLAGATTATIDVTGIVTDALVEGTETVIVTLTATDNPGITVAGSPADTATVSIVDGNTANVSIAATTDGNETGPVDGLFTVTQSVTSASDTVITYTMAGTATAGGTDYTSLSGSVTVLAGTTTATIDVTGIVADALVEGTETVIVTLTATDNPGITVAGSPADTATVSIVDGNTANVSIAATTDGNETGPVDGLFTVTQSVTSASDTVITYTMAGTATAGGTDYTSLSGSVTVLAGTTTATIDVTGIVADALVEGPETVIVTLTATDNPGITVAGSPADTATVNILDNNAANVSIAATTDANETGSVNGLFTVTQSATSATDTVVTYTVAGTATPGGTDYTTLSGSVTVLAGVTTATIDVSGIVDDALVEGDETVIVTLTATDNPGITVAASPADTATVNVLDNNAATVSIASTTDANEAGSVDGVFTVTLSAASASDTIITYTVAGTATATTDYTALTGTVTIPNGSITANIDVTGIVADALVEGTETVIVTLTGTDNPGITVAGSPADTAAISIIDGNAATVSIAATTDANEAGPVDGQFTVTQSTTSASDTVVTYTVAGTATATTDYTALTGTVTIPNGATTATIDVTGIIADALVEGTETVIVTLTGTDNPGITVAASPNDTATVNILDSTGATVSIAPTTNGAEAGPVDAVFTVTQSAIAVNDTVISYAVGGTATSGSDYAAPSGTVTVVGGATSATIIVPVIDDVNAEGVAETVVVTLSSISASDPGISIAASPDDNASITIADNDSDLITTKTVNNATPVEGGTIIYTISVTNSAGVQATNVSLTDSLPAGVTYVSDDSGGAYNNSTGIWSIGTLDTLAPTNLATLSINATVDVGASALAQPITNTTTTAVGDQADPDTSTDTLTASITVDNNADLVTTKTVDNASPVENATITYTLSVLNNGAAQATNVSLTDMLPAGVTYVSDDSGGTFNPVTGVWTPGTLNNGVTQSLNISATVDTGANALTQPITNSTTAAVGDQLDPDVTTDDLTADITINYNADLLTTKTVDNATPLVGDTITYTLTVTNNGPAPATNVSLTDSLPVGVTYVSDDSVGAYDNVTGVWTVGDLVNGASTTLNISASVDAGAGLLPQPITNTTTAAAGDQIDPDTATDDLVESINVSLIDPTLIQLTKTVGRNRASAGEIVAYSIELRNSTAVPIGPVRLSDSPARGFKYVPGTAQLDGLTMADPTVGLPMVFDIGTIPGFVDGNGNGIADPGEPGYAVFSYRMVAGSGVAPGVWSNTAVATISCDTCFVSNTANADIEIIEDTLFDLGTVIGKVFYDADRDGWQDSGEAGIAAAMVALDDGSYALTDEFGRYHFPAVKPGQRLLKINLNSLVGRATATNDKTRIVSVTPGLMAKVNFGVIIETVDAAIGAPGQLGVPVDSETIHPPLLVNGSNLMPSLLVNGEPVSLAKADISLGARQLQDVVELDSGKLKKPIQFRTEVSTDSTIEKWRLIVSGSRGEIVYTRDGNGPPPPLIEWNGIRENGRLIGGGRIYTYYLTLTTGNGQSVSSSRQLFGVNRKNTISLNLAGGAFVTGSHQLTGKAEALLSETANAIRAYPDEIVVISGHTDSVGSEISNMKLAERRARAAYDYLHTTEGLPEEQFIVQAFGESRPIATNDAAWGRELNRRVEISGDIESIDRAKNYDPYSQRPVVRINDTMVEVDESGSFRTEIELDDEQEVMGVLLSTPRGRSVETVVQLPTLQIMSPQGRFAIPVGADIPERRNFDATSADNTVLTTELQARTEPGNSVEFNGKPVEVNADGLFSAPITLRAGDNYFGLVARNPMGMLRIANLKLTVDASNIDAPEIVVDPIPQLALQLPPPGIPMTNSNLVIPGFTLPGNRVFINDNEVSVDADGRFMATVELRLGENPFTARVVDIDGYEGEIEQTFAYDGNPMFFMALVDGTFSQLQTSGSLQAAGTDKSNETVTEGRVAYYLKGHVLGKYLLTSAFDSGQQELGELFSDLTAQDNDRLLTNLDPYTLYPVYGDASTVVYDAQSQSKFYLALESDTVTALIGNYALNFTDTELASYQRTLFGGSATYQSVAKDESGDHKTKAQAFYANIAQAHVRDEMRATGGSLYYLSQREVIEGSEHVSIIVRDQDSGLILTRSALQQGLDYNIDYVDGRLLTNRPISSFSPDTSLIDSDPLGGSAVYVQIDYETALNGFEQTATGARLRQSIGRNLAVGVTSVDEDQLGSEYSLKAADAEYRLGLHSRLVAEYADSAGNNSTVNISDDGGLTYQAVSQMAGNSGSAYKIAAEIDAGELFGQYDRLLLNTYFKHLDTGFSASSVTSEQGSEKSGIGAILKISDTSSLLGRYEQQTQLGTGSENTLATLQWNLIRKIWGVAVELEDRAGFAGDATLAAARINYRWTDTLSTTLEHQQTLQGLVNDQSTAGVAYRATEKLILDASATHGTTGDSAQLGAQLDWRGNRLYMGQQFNDVIASGVSNNRLVGIEAPFGPEGVVYSEYRWSDLSLGRQQQAMFGARQRFQMSDNLQIQLSGEHSAQKDSNSDPGERYALSVGATFANDSGITLSTRNEYRKDSRSIASEQFLSTSNVEMALGDNLAVLGKYRFSKSESSPQINRDIDFTEASIGLAYRPVEHDRLNLLARYTRLSNTPTEFQIASISTGMGSDIFAVDWSYQLSQRIEWVGKQALRWSENGADTTDLKSQTALTVQRLNWRLPRKFLLGTEYRMMSQDVANDRRDGFVTELMWEGFDPLRLGIGYNFSSVSDNDYADYDFKTRGMFLRVQGKF